MITVHFFTYLTVLGLIEIDDYMRKKDSSTSINIRPSNVT